MAALIGLSVYQINSQDPIPLASVPTIDFPFAGILVRGIAGGQALSTGVIVYSTIQTIANGSQYLVKETAAALAAAS